MSGGISATTVIAGAGLALSAAGTAATVAGQSSAAGAAAGQAGQSQAWQIYQQQVQAKAMSAQAAWARSLAQQRVALAGQAEGDALARGEVTAKANDTQTVIGQMANAQTAGTARARLAARGTDLSTSSGGVGALGDIAAVGAFQKEVGDFNTATIRSNATREAYGHALEGVATQDDVAVAQAQQDNARPGLTALSFNPGNTLLTGGATALAGASNLASKWWTFQQQGGFGGGTNADPFLDPSLNNPAAAWAAASNVPNYGAGFGIAS